MRWWSSICSAGVLLRDAPSTMEAWMESLNCTMLESSGGLASAAYNASMDTTGWDVLEIHVNASNQNTEPELSAAAAGFLEGSLMAQRVSDFVFNTYADYLDGNSTINASWAAPFFGWQQNQEAWALAQIASPPAGEDAQLWSTVELLYSQLAGLAAGLQASGVELYGMSAWRAAMMANLMGEYDDVMDALEPASRLQWEAMGIKELARALSKREHCSAFVSLGDYNSELFVGHNMWWGFEAMMPVFKTYRWGNASTVQMSSFPGVISSVDDFYSLPASHQRMAVMETTNNVYRTELYDLLKPETLVK